jgi:hypothetical protein
MRRSRRYVRHSVFMPMDLGKRMRSGKILDIGYAEPGRRVVDT